MKVLISGQRNWEGRRCAIIMMQRFIELPTGTEIIHGAAEGADRMADRIARVMGFRVRRYPIYKKDWEHDGLQAGNYRNQRMIDEEHPDLILCFFTDRSTAKGTNDMLRRSVVQEIPHETFVL